MRLSWLLAGCAVGCVAPAPEPVAVSATSHSEGSEEDRLDEGASTRITFSLEHASLSDVSRLLGRVTGLRVVLDAEVDSAADCVTISVMDPDPITIDEALAVTRRAFAPVGVVLERSDTQLVFSRVEGAELPSCPARVAVQAAASPAPPARPTPTQVALSIRTGIRSVSADEVLMTRAALDELLRNQASLFAAVRLIPHEENGRVVAVKMYGVRRTSVMGLLGFHNGDAFQRINGYDITTPQGALEAYEHARSAAEIRVEIQRRGQANTRVIRIVEALP